MTDELHHWSDIIGSCTVPERLFGDVPTAEAVNEHYRRLSRAVHPDLHGGSFVAQETFRLLTSLRDRALQRIEAGIYGTKEADPAPKPGFVPVSLKSKKATRGHDHAALAGRAAIGTCCRCWSSHHLFNCKDSDSKH